MQLTSLLTLASALPFSNAVSQGFNYGTAFTDGSPVQQADFEADFTTANSLQGTSGFTSARLFTMIQAGTTNTPTSAIQAAINTKTHLLLGLFLSAGQEAFNNELAALSSAIQQYGQSLLDLVDYISVGSEDLYRISEIGIINKSNPGDSPDNVVNYISQVRKLIANTIFKSVPVGHVDTWTAWVNGSNSAVIDAVDWLGTDAYPYFQDTMANSIENGEGLFFDAYNATVAVATGKPVKVAETGWPVSGDTRNLAVANVDNAKTYWDQVGCRLFGHIDTWWYTLSDTRPSTPNPSFGIVGNPLSTTPLFDLSCPDQSSSSSAASSATSTASSAVSSATSASTTGVSSEQVSNTQAPEQTSSTMIGSPISVSHPTSTAVSAGSPDSNTQAGHGSGSVSKSASSKDSEPASSVPSASSSMSSEYGDSTPFTLPPAASSANDKTTLGSEASGFTSATSAPPALPTNDKTTLITVASQTAPPLASTPAAASGCPTILAQNNYQFPHLIIPVSKDTPDTAYGSSTYSPEISPSTSDIFNFDIPPSYKGKTCSIVFMLPQKSEMTTSSFNLTGSGGLTFAKLKDPATEQTTYNTVGDVVKNYTSIEHLQPGNSYVVGVEACPAGDRIGIEVAATGSLDLEYFQDFNPKAIGLYITLC